MNKKTIIFTDIIKYIFLCIYALMVIFPLVFTLLSSFKTNEEILLTPWNLPTKWDFSIYYKVWTEYGVSTYFFNSVYYSVLSVLIGLIINVMAAYAIARMQWKLRNWVFGLFMFGLMVPIHSQIIPLYIGFTRMGFSNPRITLAGLFIAFSIPTTVFILVGFMKSLPYELEESAIIEGASIFRILRSIILPLLTPAIATVTIFNFLAVWNDYFSSLIFINGDKDKTLQLGITRFQGSFVTNYSLLLSAIIIAVIPSIIIYVILQDKIIGGLMTGAIKG